jgi:prevent-host-death family protein
MKQVTMLEFRNNSRGVLRRLAAGERLLLSHRGKPVARLEPVQNAAADPVADPFLTIGSRAAASPSGATKHNDIDRILYGGK